MIGNEEQKAAYIEALGVEKAGYEQKVEAAKVSGDEIAGKRYSERIKQVDAEIKKAHAEPAAGESEADEPSLEQKIKKANGETIDALAEELGFVFGDDISTVKDKKAALLQHAEALQA